MGEYLENVLEALVGHRCRIETTDGTIRFEPVYSIGYKEIKCPLSTRDNGCMRLPVVLYYDEREAEGVELAILHSIEIDDVQGAGVR